MKNSLVLFGVIILLLLAAAFCHQPDAKPEPVNVKPSSGESQPGPYKGPGTGFAVVELYTSEGCSSCPPADAVLARVATAYPHVYVLGFHVDYWDRLGWKDKYSNAAYTQRQEDYGQAFHLSSIYTPEDVINGEKELVGGDERALRAAIESELAKPAGKQITLDATHKGNTIHIAYQISNRDAGVLQVALLQSHGESQVMAGENKGRHLSHVNIVRGFKTAPAGDSGTLTFEIPSDIQPADCIIIAFLQKEGAQQPLITGAAETGVR